MSRLDLSALCVDAATSLVNRGEYPSVGSVARNVCAAHNVGRLEDLGGSLHSIPALSLLLHIERTVAACADAFIATHGVACLVDFERHVISSLVASCTPPLGAGDAVPPPADFAGFGVGCLRQHPAVRAHWPLASVYDQSCAIGFVDAAQHLVDLLASRPSLSSGMPTVGRAEVEQCLVEATGHTLGALGIALMPPALPTALHALRDAAHALRELQVAATRRALERIDSMSMDGCANDESQGKKGRDKPATKKATCRASAQPSNGPTAVDDLPAHVRMRTPADPTIRRVLARCVAIVGTNSYAPSMSATRAAVDKLATASPPRRKKRARGGGQDGVGGVAACGGASTAEGWEEGWVENADAAMCIDREASLVIVSEYLMLHLGSSKWRQRKWELSTHEAAVPPDEGAKGAGASDDSSDSESSSSDDSSVTDSSEASEASPTTGAGAAASAEVATAAAATAEVTTTAVSDEPPTAAAGQRSRRQRSRPAGSSPDAGDAGNTTAVAPNPNEISISAAPSACSDPNEISIDDDDGTADENAMLDASNAAPAAVRVHALRRADGAIATVPPRLAPSRPLSSSIRPVVVSGAAMGALGCLPWHGTITCAEPLNATDAWSVGRWGEALVYAYLRATLPPSRRVEWVNGAEETRAPYDLTISEHGQRAHRGGGGGALACTFIEVKTTRYLEHNAFALSYPEWAFLAAEPPVRYQIVRVSGAGDPRGVRLTVIDEPLQRVKDGELRLCMAI